MAAYAALTSLSRTTELLLDIASERSSSSTHELEQLLAVEISSLYQVHLSINLLQELLEIYPRETIDLFEAQIIDMVDEAEGIIGRVMSGQLRSMTSADGDDSTLASLQLQTLRVDEIGSMSEEIDDVVVPFSSSGKSTLYPTEGLVIGFGDVFQNLIRLVTKDSSAELRMVSIVGMGGIGKTHLARAIYNYIPTLELFEIRGWVTVSRDFSARDILMLLAAMIRPFIKIPKKRGESIENHVRDNLRGRRFLIVLDDVWSHEALRSLMDAFPDDSNGSRILLTTRMMEVAVVAEPERIVEMRFMDEVESYHLLRYKIFRKEDATPDLQDLLKRIGRRCRGLPLAIVLVAGILSGMFLHEWEDFFESLVSETDDKSTPEMVDWVVSLSYVHVPLRLRSWLLYMGAFPEDHEIKVARLTKQLLAQGFLRKPPHGISEREQVERDLEELVQRNLVSVLKRKSIGGIKSLCLHDLVRDFCLKKAQDEGLIHCVTGKDSDEDDLTRGKIKVTFDLDSLRRICRSSADNTNAIMCFGHGRISSLSSIGKFRMLKSLDLVNIEIKSFPMEVLDLLLLRFLALSHVPELPPSVSNLRYLETLIVNPRDASTSTLPDIVCLPCEILKMPMLLHVISFCCGAFPDLNSNEGYRLTRLRTLNAVMNFDCGEDTISMIPNIEKLGIFYFGAGRATYSIKNTERLDRLEKLKLWVLAPFSAPQHIELSGFPPNLRKLNLKGIKLSSRDMDVIGELPHLQALKLRQNTFEGDEWRVSSNGFAELRFLLLAELGLKHWVADVDDIDFFPRLFSLVIRDCNNLSEIPKGVQECRSLALVEVVGGKKSLVESATRIRDFRNNDNLQVLIMNKG